MQCQDSPLPASQFVSAMNGMSSSSLYPLSAEVGGANEAIQHGKDLGFHQEENIKSIPLFHVCLTYNGQLEDQADLGAGGHLALEGAGVCGVRELQLQCILSSSEMLLFSNCIQFYTIMIKFTK